MTTAVAAMEPEEPNDPLDRLAAKLEKLNGDRYVVVEISGDEIAKSIRKRNKRTPQTPRPDHDQSDAHEVRVGAGPALPQANTAPSPLQPAPAVTDFDSGQQPRPDAHIASAAVEPTWNGSTTAQVVAATGHRSPLADPFLALAADVLDDAEKTHNANRNRLRQLTRTATDKDGEERGFGLDESHPDVARLAALVDMLEQVEKDAAKNLTRALKAHPLAPFIKAQRGVGDKQAARLLAAIGDPYWNDLHDRPRTVSELWAYCGLAPGLKRTKGVRSNWSTAAKTRAWLVIESCMKQLSPACKTDTGIALHWADCGCSPYRVVVDMRRLHTAETHPDWTPKHSQLDGMRVASKALLRDLWLEAKRIHEADTG